MPRVLHTRCQLRDELEHTVNRIVINPTRRCETLVDALRKVPGTIKNHEVIEVQTSDDRLVTAADDVHMGCHLGPFQGGRDVCVMRHGSHEAIVTDIHAALYYWTSLLAYHRRSPIPARSPGKVCMRSPGDVEISYGFSVGAPTSKRWVLIVGGTR